MTFMNTRLPAILNRLVNLLYAPLDTANEEEGVLIVVLKWASLENSQIKTDPLI
jgi:hypothetical protein